MKYQRLFYSFLVFISISSTAQSSLSGKISDAETKEALAGATIYIPDLRSGVVSGPDGKFNFARLPKTKLLVQVSYFSYKTAVLTVDLSLTNTLDVELESSVREIDPVVITGNSQAGDKNKNPTPITIISKIDLVQNSSTNIIDALANKPGIAQVSTGAGISKPVIRGLGYNRVVVVNDGIRQEG